jgi:Uma2 family endonuclease
MTIETQLMTAEDFFVQYTGQRYELIEGEPVPLPHKPHRQHDVMQRLSAHLGQHIVTHNLGYGLAGGTGFLLRSNPDLIRDPDFAFCSTDRLEENDGQDFNFFAPDLAGDVISPADAAGAILEKITDFLSAGTRQYWAVYPDQEKVIVLRPDATAVTLDKSDTLYGGDVVPGFALNLSWIFTA